MSRFILHRKVLISMLFAALVLLGVVSYRQLPVELFPNAELPFLIVQVNTMQEMDPEYIEQQAIVPLEGAVSTLEGIESIESNISQSDGIIFIYFEPSVNIKYAYLRLDEKVNAIRDELDENFVVNVFKIDTESLSNVFMSLQVRGEGGVDRVRELADEHVEPELANIDGIANVEVSGGRQKSVEIILDEEASEAYGVTPSTVRQLLSDNNRAKVFVGQARQAGQRYFVNVVADYTDVEQIGNIIVNETGPVHLRDVAEIFFGVKEPASISRVNGKDAVTVQLSRDSQMNMIDLAHKARAEIDRLNTELQPLGLELVIQTDAAEDIEENINNIIELALIGAVLAVIVLWMFLRNFRWVMLITLAIPISVYTAFNFFYAADISVNSLTLVGMALAVGMLLDNSVVVMENIYRLLSRRKSPDDAVVQGSREVWRSILAATLTTVTVFLPFVFAENFMVKILGKHIGVSIISTLLVSLVVALLLIPMLTHVLLRWRGGRTISALQVVSQKLRLLQIYNVLLKSSMRFPLRTISGAILLFFVSLLIAMAVSISVPQEVEVRSFNIYVTMDEGSILEQTDLMVGKIEDRLLELDEHEEITSTIYEEEAVLVVKLEENFESINDRSLEEIKDNVDDQLNNIAGGDISFEEPTASRRFAGGGGGGRNPGAGFQRLLGIGSASEKILIKGRDFDAMLNLAQDLEAIMDDMDDIQRVSVSVTPERPEMHLYFDQMAMNQYGVTPQQVASELAGFRSEMNSQVTFKQGTEEYDVIIRTDAEQKDTDKSLADLQRLDIPTSNQELIELQDIADPVFAEGRASISRVNQERQVEVNYSFLSEITDSKDLLNASRTEIDQVIAALDIPSGLAVEVVHDDRDLSDFTFLILAAFILIYMILAAVFESLSTPVVMMFTIPLAAVGSLWALIFTGNSLLNANTLIGFLILLGIVVNNGIIYIDYTRILRRRGFNRSRALMMAGQARVRPILITAITTMIAMLPLALGKEEYVELIGAPFAITVIGGLALSTLFTLVFIPTMYSGLETALQWLRDLNWKWQAVQAAAFIAGVILVFINVDATIWRIIDLVLITFLIPGVSWFVMNSLRRANAEIVAADEPLHIKIQHLVKIYDEPSRFVREWNKGKTIRARAGVEKEHRSWRDFDELLWQAPILGFLIYFTYFYLNSYFWAFVFSHAVFFTVLGIWRPILRFGKRRKPRLLRVLDRLLFWGLPLLNLAFFYWKWQALGSVIFIAVLWYLALAIYTTSNRLHSENINVARITGKFSGMRRNFYRFVQSIPVIGKHKTPFRALDGVSLDIGSGMFGLLGPNGAGKTTLMRIICGILDASRGKIWINGNDLDVYREEFQGLIGYLPQDFGMYENLTAHDYLEYQAILKGLTDPQSRHARIQQVLESVHMEERQHEKIGSFSGGMKQRIGIAQTLLHLPRILVVDEPTAGLDPRERIRFRNLLVELSRERIVIFSTHIIEDIASSCNTVAVLDRGRLKYTGAPTAMLDLAKDRVWQFFVDVGEFDNVQDQFKIVHHMRVKDKIRVRAMADEQPTADAVTVQPTLEDAYLYLLQTKEASV